MTFLPKFLLAALVGSAASSFAASIPRTILPDNIVRCEPNAGCVNKMLYGRNYQVITTPRFIVMVSVSREGSYTRADVSVTNNTDMPLNVSPDDFRVEVVTPKPKVLLYVPPQQLNLPAAQPAAAAAPAPQPATSVSATNPGTQTDGAAKVEDVMEQKAVQQEVADKAASQQNLAATSIPPNEVTRGRVYFESDKKANLVNVVLPIAGVVFEFPYALKR
jgi:hypothetical protein